MRSPNALIPYEQNAKIHSRQQIEKLAEVMKTLGFDVPIVVDENNNILKGHCRREAAIVAELEEVAVIVRTGLSDAQKTQLRISDNKLAQSPWDDEALKFELQSLIDLEADLELTGFSQDEIDALMSEEFPQDFTEIDPDAIASELDVTCPKCKYQFTTPKK
jgi:ParB-like chromosome segregation protein Spo0J